MRITRIARFFASCGGVGFSPIAPGTAGSLLALLIAWFLPTASITAMLPIVGGMFLFGLLVTHYATHGHGDPSWLVIDEVAGMLLALVGVPPTIEGFAVAFVIFRVFDIFKPCGIDKLQRLPGAWGVMLDDIAAGFGTVLLVYLVFYISPF